ncbi:MAG: TonB-dependent receptor [Crocinitomicaceae bacterium]|nr:TonB-dependent receptor [Crocinitomicaceae bacterium]
MRTYLLLFSLLFLSIDFQAQGLVRGRVIDGDTGEPMFSSSVVSVETGQGVTTDFDGIFRIQVKSFPTKLMVSFIGYTPNTITVQDETKNLEIKLFTDQILIEEAEVVGERISEKQKQAPLTVESMDLIAIKEAPSGNFYEGLGTLKGVDLTSASLGFKIVNTRGFNSTSPVRSLQLIDGVDNQSPGLNFSLGNFLGAPDLDVKNVEIVAGASSAFYGPGAFNGVVNMETKDPFVFPGLSVSTKIGEATKKGESNLFEFGFRWAQVINNKNDKPLFAYKINAFRFQAYDWEATNYNPVENSISDINNPGGYDAVNIYGDEYNKLFNFNEFRTTENYQGLMTFHRNGYKEIDLVDYNTENLKVSMSGSWRIQPEKTYESPELLYSFNMGQGSTVYQGDNRFRLQDIEFYQHRVELRKKNNWFIRAYRTNEDAGNSYDPYATALLLQTQTRSDEVYKAVYETYWVNSIGKELISELDFPVLEFVGWDSTYYEAIDAWIPFPVSELDQDAVNDWYTQYSDSISLWHTQVQEWTAQGDAGNPLAAGSPLGYLEPGTDEFNQLFNQLTTSKNNNEEQGTRFHDLSSLIHLHGEYIIDETWFDEIRIGANHRRYTPNSEGTIFSDTAGVVITNTEYGSYLGFKKHFPVLNEMTASGTIRVDKNQNFDAVISPALSLVWTNTTNTSQDIVRLSFSSALRNPTLADQYLYLDVGPATLIGNLNGAQDLITPSSLYDYLTSDNSSFENGGSDLQKDIALLDSFDIEPIRPEEVKTLEVGLRTTFKDKLYVDASAYYSKYNHFIGYIIGLDCNIVEYDIIGGDEPLRDIAGIDVYRYAANSLNEVITTGASVGLQYYLNNIYSVSGNYSWNRLVKTNEDDPIIPAFNTPEHKFNIGINARGINTRGKNKFGFGFNYKWVQQFVFEGSPQFTGTVPQYDVVDGQINLYIEDLKTTFKIGGSNLLRNWHIETYGGPMVGRLAYFSVLYEFNK